MGTAKMMSSACRATSAVVTACAPGASTSTISSMRSGAPEPDTATSYPPAVAARAIAVPIFPAPTMPKRLWAASCPDTGRSSARGHKARDGRGQLNRRICEELPHPWNHLASVQLDGRQFLLVRNAPGRIGQVESTEPEQSDDPRDLVRDRLRRPEIQGSLLDLTLEPLHRRTGPSPLGGGVLEHVRPMRILDV